MDKGIGYQEYRKMRMVEENISSTDTEKIARHCIYFGRSHIEDFETGTVARGHLKVGRAKYITSLQRGRNEGGADFRIYYEMVLYSKKDTELAEKLIQDLLCYDWVQGSQGQMELYDIADSDLENTVLSAKEHIQARNIQILEINSFVKGRQIVYSLPLEKRKKKEEINTFTWMFG